MSTMSGKSIVLEEENDPNYVPTPDEIAEYAVFLGMELPRDQALLWIAQEGLKAPLPAKWKPCKSQDGEVYYFNFSTGESVWEHPCDQFYRGLFEKEREKARLAPAANSSTSALLTPATNTLRRSPGTILQPMGLIAPLKEKIILGKLQVPQHISEPVAGVPVPVSVTPQTASLDVSSSFVATSDESKKNKLEMEKWITAKRVELEAEKEAWEVRRRQEMSEWIKAKEVEMDAEKERRLQAIQSKEDKDIENATDESAARQEAYRADLGREVREFETSLQQRRNGFSVMLKEELSRKEEVLKQRIAELEQGHSTQLDLCKKQWKMELEGLEAGHAEESRIRRAAHEARVAELDLQGKEAERAALAREKSRSEEWAERLKKIEKEGKDRCDQERSKRRASVEMEQATLDSDLLQKIGNLERQLIASKADLQQAELIAAGKEQGLSAHIARLEEQKEREKATMSAQIAQLEGETIEMAEQTRMLEKDLHQRKELAWQDDKTGEDDTGNTVRDLTKQLSKLEILQEETASHLEKALQERNEWRERATQSPSSQPARPRDDEEESDDDFNDIVSEDFSECSDVSERENSHEANSGWKRQLSKEQSHLQSAMNYLTQQRRFVSRARTLLLKDQQRWKKDRDMSLKSSRAARQDLEHDLRRRKKFLDHRAQRLNSDIGQYRSLKRSLSQRRDSLRSLQQESTPPPKGRNEERMEMSPERQVIVDPPMKLWQSTAAPSSSSNQNMHSSPDARSALQNHYGWLKSFRSEIQRAAADAGGAGVASPRYGVPLAPGRSAALLSPLTPSHNNDITIRIKVEQ